MKPLSILTWRFVGIRVLTPQTGCRPQFANKHIRIKEGAKPLAMIRVGMRKGEYGQVRMPIALWEVLLKNIDDGGMHTPHIIRIHPVMKIDLDHMLVVDHDRGGIAGTHRPKDDTLRGEI